MKRILILLLVLSIPGSLFADQKVKRLAVHVTKALGKQYRSSDFVRWNHGGISFYFLKTEASGPVSKIKPLIESTVSIMKRNIKNHKRWQEYTKFPFLITYDRRLKSGAYANWRDNIIWSSFSKASKSYQRFSYVIPHELCHIPFRNESSQLRNLVEKLRKKYIKNKTILEYKGRKGEQENVEEFFCNAAEAFIFHSNESFPKNRNDLKRSLPEMYKIMKRYYQ